MTKEELARKKGLKVNKEVLTPAEKLVIKPSEPQIEPVQPIKQEKPKGKVGKPKKRKNGDKKMSFWIDEDIVPLLYKDLAYGDTIGERINDILRKHYKGDK